MARKTTSKKKTPAKKKSAAKKTTAKKRSAARKSPARSVAKKAGRPTAPARKAPARKTSGGGLSADVALRLELEDLYAAYGDTLDHGDIDGWPLYFTEDCTYKLISRENYDLGLPLGTMFAEKRGGLEDRVTAVVKTTVYHERAITHLITGVRLLDQKGGVIESTANYAVLETLPNQYTKVLNSGRYLDKVVRQGGKLLFRDKLCIFDSALVPASIIYPI